jgi:hypothetical protein
MTVAQDGVKTECKIFGAAPYENDQDYVNKNNNTPFTQLTLLTVHATLRLCLYRAAKIP